MTRSHVVPVRLDDDEYAQLVRAAQADEQSLSELIRRRALHPTEPPTDWQQFAQEFLAGTLAPFVDAFDDDGNPT